MQLSDKIKKFSVEQAIDYRNRNPVKNLPKLLDWADTFCAGKFEGQRRAISLEGDETTTDSRRSEKEVKRAQRTQKIVCKERKKLCAKNAKAPSPSRETVLFPAVPSRGRPGHTVPHREKRHQRCRCCVA